jgi:hypothetical protein
MGELKAKAFRRWINELNMNGSRAFQAGCEAVDT